MIGGGDALELAQRAPIGDRTTSALVGADGTIDWWCPGSPDGAAAFHRLVHAAGGACRLGPDGPPVVGEQSWAGAAAPVVRTVIRSTESIVQLDDAVVDGTIVRRLTVLRGPVDVVLDVVPGRGFGRPRRVDRFAEGIGFDGIVVRGLPEGTPVRLDSGDQRIVTIAVERQERATTAGNGRPSAFTSEVIRRRLTTLDREWSDLLENGYDGPRRGLVRDALRQLLLLSDPVAGVPVRSITTSLPSGIGNDRNVDGRLVWLGDAARLVRLLERLDRPDLAAAGRDWVAAALDSAPPLPVLTRSGDRPPLERDLDLDGWRGHRPVRIGSPDGAERWSLADVAEASMVLDARRHRAQLRQVTTWLAEHAGRPDHGRWGLRGRPRRHVDGVIAARQALTAATATLRSGDPLSAEAVEAERAARALGVWLHEQGRFSRGDRAGWRRAQGDDTSDGALLRWIAPWDDDPPGLPDDAEGEAEHRTALTIDQTLAQLDDGGLTHRHLPHVDDGFAPGQGADVAVSFELVAALARVGRWEAAHDRFETALGAVGSMGVAPSHLDPRTLAHRGNRPDAPALMAVIDAVLALQAGPR